VRVVKLALEVDLRLGARLAGAVKPEFQEHIINLINELQISQELKSTLLRIVNPFENFFIGEGESIILKFTPASTAICTLTAYMSRKIGFQATEILVLSALEDQDSDVRKFAAEALGKIGSQTAIEPLLLALSTDPDSDVRKSAAEALGEIGSQTAVESLLLVLSTDRDSDVRKSAAEALGKIGSQIAIEPLLLALSTDRDSDVRESAIHALGKIGSEAVIKPLMLALVDQNIYIYFDGLRVLGELATPELLPEFHLLLSTSPHPNSVLNAIESIQKRCGYYSYHYYIAESSLSKDFKEKNCLLVNRMKLKSRLIDFLLYLPIYNTSERSAFVYYFSPSLARKVDLQGSTTIFSVSLIQVLSSEGRNTLLYFLDRLVESDWIGLERKQELSQLISDIKALSIDEWASEFLGVEPRLETDKGLTRYELKASVALVNLLHLSDLHFGTLDQANLWSTQLRTDLRRELSIPHLDALILSGDIANYSTQEEYKAAEQFLSNLCRTLTLNPEQIILVPANHDLNWKLAKKAYKLIDRDDYDGKPQEGHYIEESASVIRVRDEAEYKQRFAHFSQFYETIKQKPYPLDYDQQYTLDHLKEQNLLILGLNSAC